MPPRMSPISIDSAIRLPSGGQLPRLGLGVYQARSTECVDAVKLAIETGYRHIDTAQGYRNEDLVGRGISSASPPVPRSSLFLTTKYMPSHTPQSMEDVYSQLRKSLKPLHRSPVIPPTREGRAELKKLRMEQERQREERESQRAQSAQEGNSDAIVTSTETEPYIDLFLIHAPWGGQKGREANWAALTRAQEEGWVRDIGVSNFGISHLSSLSGPVPAVNQIELHPWCQQRPIVSYCLDKGIALQAYCPLVRGDKARWEDPVLQRVCGKLGKGEAQVLIRWSLQKGFIPLPKSVHPDRIRSNADVYDFELDEEDMAALDALDEGAAGACSWNPVDAD